MMHDATPAATTGLRASDDTPKTQVLTPAEQSAIATAIQTSHANPPVHTRKTAGTGNGSHGRKSKPRGETAIATATPRWVPRPIASTTKPASPATATATPSSGSTPRPP